MPRLMLLRHAKSSWAEAAPDDFDRPLNRRGRRAAAAMGAHMASCGLIPRRILCSPAVRARETLNGVLSTLPTAPDVRFVSALYAASETGYLTAIRAHADDAESLLIIGHNPAIEDTALQLAGNRTAPAYAAMREKFPTAALAVLDFEGDWRALRAQAAHLAAFVRPRDLALA